MGLLTLLLKTLSDDTLRNVEDKMKNTVDSLDNNPRKQVKIDNQRLKIVNEICSRSAGKLPHSEHGWYLPEDDN